MGERRERCWGGWEVDAGGLVGKTYDLFEGIGSVVCGDVRGTEGPGLVVTSLGFERHETEPVGVEDYERL